MTVDYDCVDPRAGHERLGQLAPQLPIVQEKNLDKDQRRRAAVEAVLRAPRPADAPGSSASSPSSVLTTPNLESLEELEPHERPAYGAPAPARGYAGAK